MDEGAPDDEDTPAGASDEVDRRWARMENEANEEAFHEVVQRQRQLRACADERIDELVEQTRSSARLVRILSVVTFSVGLALLGLGIYYGQGGDTPAQAIGFGSAGTASMLGVLFYQPMERINRATSDLAQQETMLRTWSIAVDLELMAADTFERETVREAAERLRESSRELSGSIERYVEDDGTAERPNDVEADGTQGSQLDAQAPQEANGSA